MILVKTFYAQNDLRNFTYLIIDKKSGDSWVIDPFDGAPIIKEIKKEGLNLKGILNTHQHFDHIRGNQSLLEVFETKISKLKGSEKIELSDTHEISSLRTPGHTPDHEVFVWKAKGEAKALFSGDTLFNAGVGNCKGGGDVNQLYESTELLKRVLPARTMLYPGHDYIVKNLEFAASCEPNNLVIKQRLKDMKNQPVEKRTVFTLGDENEVNPFLRLEALGAQGEASRELFQKLRSLRDSW